MKKFCFSLLLVFFTMFSLNAQVLDPVQWKFEIQDLNDTEFELVATATVEPMYHIYSTSMPELGPLPTVFNIEPSEYFEPVGTGYDLTEVPLFHDDIFEVDYHQFSGTASFGQKFKKLKDGPFQLVGELEYQACKDGMCVSLTEDIDMTYGDQQVLSGDDEDAGVGGHAKSNIWSMILEAILWGFAALLTPCVFPMIPMTVSFFMHGEGESKAQGRFKAFMYFLFIVLLYTLPIAIIILVTWLVGGNSVTADIFNWLATHWLPNILFFLVFMVFAASFFGAFEITLGSNMVNKSDSKQNTKNLGGIFFMALTLVLVSFACTGPIVGTVLIKSTSGEFWAPIVTMFAFAVAFALPFALFAFFPNLLQRLPKSGGWLNSVKVVLGFIEVALGFKFLSVADQTYHWHLLDREVYLGIWIVCFTLLGLYLLGKIRFKGEKEVKELGVFRLILIIIDFTFVIYMIPGMWGAPLKALSGYLPPKQTLDFDLNRIIEENSEKVIDYVDAKFANMAVAPQGQTQAVTTATFDEEPKYADLFHLAHNLKGYFDYDQALACAKVVGKPIFIDFTGHGCVNCREMEANVWSDPRVKDMLRNDFVICALYVDDKTSLPKEEWYTSTYDGKEKKTIGRKWADFQISKFGTNAQPYYCLMDHNGNLLMKPRAYDLDKDAFVAFLKEGLKNFQEGTFYQKVIN
ncbi:MAG: thioredoxin family protein [Bacteroidales bacterium]|nr:thioredoxin family protein [Bacteroidales bacterium]